MYRKCVEGVSRVRDNPSIDPNCNPHVIKACKPPPAAVTELPAEEEEATLIRVRVRVRVRLRVRPSGNGM